MSFQINSPVIKNGEDIPVKYTCNGVDVSPALSWEGIPAGTQSYALIVHDPDAPVGDWVHWVLYNIPAARKGLEEGVAKTERVTGTGIQGRNDFHRIGYSGPCPPPGKPHRYYFNLYALDTSLQMHPGASKTEVERAMQGHILGHAQLMGMYRR